MTRESIKQHTVEVLNQLPESKVMEISDFADFVNKKYEEQMMLQNIQKLAIDSQSFDFLIEEEDIYTMNDIKSKYNG